MKKYFYYPAQLALAVFSLVAFDACVSNKPTERIEFTSQDAYPEGITSDGKAFYVSSTRNGSIARISEEGNHMILYADSSLKSSYGLKIHPNGNHLYAAISDANYSKYTSPDTRKKLAKLLVIDRNDGKKINEIDLSGIVPGDHFINDMAFDSANNCYITDSYADCIYRVSASGEASLFAKDSLFATEGISLNGIVYHPGGFLLVNSTNAGAIYKVDLEDPKKVSQVKINQFFLGADGMLLNDSSTLVLVVNGNNDKVFQLSSNDNWITAEIKATTLLVDRFSYPSTATFWKDDVWVMNAKFNELVDSNAVPSKNFAIQKAVFKPIPKKLRN